MYAGTREGSRVSGDASVTSKRLRLTKRVFRPKDTRPTS